MSSRSRVAHAAGKALRQSIPRSQHGTLHLPDDRDPLGIIEEQNQTRLQDLIGVRIGRMAQSPFAYFRGTAGPMAYDLTANATTDIRLVACGDAHISNFGLFASPERNLLFDLNDFDESGIAPWEWDLQRLAASIHIGGRANGIGEASLHEITSSAVRAYQGTLRDLMQQSALERFYTQINMEVVEQLLTDPAGRKVTNKIVAKARRRTSEQVLAKLTTTSETGRPMIVDQPPITRHADHADRDDMLGLLRQYLATLREDSAVLIQQFELVDVVLRVVGVGSVGTRCYVILLLGQSGEPFFLQVKEARRSVLFTYGGMTPGIPGDTEMRASTDGHRVVAAQRVLQAQSDPFLGWVKGWAGDLPDRPPVDYYWRQFRDMKGSVDLEQLTPSQFGVYVSACARLLARAHSQSGTAHSITGYLGTGGPFADAIADWAAAYADVCEQDHAALLKAAKSGRFPIEYDV